MKTRDQEEALATIENLEKVIKLYSKISTNLKWLNTIYKMVVTLKHSLNLSNSSINGTPLNTIRNLMIQPLFGDLNVLKATLLLAILSF